MTDPFSVIGLCLGCLSLTLSTLPTGMKALSSFKSSDMNHRDFKRRLARCQSRVGEMEVNWQGRFDDSGDSSAMDDIIALARNLEDNITKYLRSSRTETTWPTIKKILIEGKHDKLRVELPHVFREIKNALWENDILEKHIAMLEKALNTDEDSFKHFYYSQTGEGSGSGPSPEKVEELNKIDSYFKTLWSLGDEVHAECTTIPNTSDWALELQNLAETEDVANWQNEPPVTIHVRNLEVFGLNGETFHAELKYVHDLTSTHTSNDRVTKLFEQRLLEIRMAGLGNENRSKSPQITCPMGQLIEDNPAVFRDLRWKVDLVRLIHAISNWTILLWPTKWFDSLCCFNLAFDVRPYESGETHCTKPMLRMKKNNTRCCGRWESHDAEFRLKNLGVALAQLVLGRPIRPLVRNEYIQLVGTRWEQTSRNVIIGDIGKLTGSKPLQCAINFCLETKPPQSAFLKEKIPPAYMQKCVKHVYEPSVYIIGCQRY